MHFFVALSVPLSVFVAFLFLPIADFIVGTDVTLNFIVLFALLFGLGIIVDDAIVVIENTHRIYNNGKVPIVRSAKEAAGEVFIPVLAGTATTLAPFFPIILERHHWQVHDLPANHVDSDLGRIIDCSIYFQPGICCKLYEARR
jgi:multidrug efflux pump subunit AcrB